MSVPKILTRDDIAKMTEGFHRCGTKSLPLPRLNPECGCMCGTVYDASGEPILGERNGVSCKHADERGRLRVVGRGGQPSLESAPPQPVAAQIGYVDPIARDMAREALAKGPYKYPSPSPAATTQPDLHAICEECNLPYHTHPSRLCDAFVPATTQPEPKPAPQAEDEIYEAALRYRVWPMYDQAGVVDAYKKLLSAAQAPLLAKIAELEKVLIEANQQLSNSTAAMTRYADEREQLLARLAELESAQPKAEPVEKLVSDEHLSAIITASEEQGSSFPGLGSPDDEYRMAVELLRYRQREERSGE